LFTGTSIAASARCAAGNPARLLKLEQWGCVEDGRAANFLVLSPEGQILQSFRAGRPLLD